MGRTRVSKVPAETASDVRWFKGVAREAAARTVLSDGDDDDDDDER